MKTIEPDITCNMAPEHERPAHERPAFDALSRAIGSLESQVEQQGKQLDLLTIVIKEDQRLHAQGIFDMRESVSGLHNSVTELMVRLTALDVRIAKMEPEVRHYTEFRYTTRGALWAVRGLLFGGAAIAGATATKIINKFWP